MPTTYNIKITWNDGTTDSYTSSSPVSYSTDGEYATFTTGDGHLHKIRLSSTRDFETWTT